MKILVKNTTIVFELQYFHEFLFYTSVINFFLVIITIVIVVVVGKISSFARYTR